jgi:hypothetical protein
MGTDYYELKKPVTSINYKELHQHILLTIFVNRAFSGTLTFRKGEEIIDFLNLLRGKQVAFTFYNGKKTKLELMKSFDSDNVQFISSYCELITLKELKILCQ